MIVKAIHTDCSTDLDLIIKPFRNPDDILFVQKWTGVEANCLDSLYDSIASADFIESIVVWCHDQPILQADICDAVFDELSSCYPTEPNDFTLRLQYPVQVDPTLMQTALELCLQYGFDKKGAGRMIIPVYEKNNLLQKWVKQANCTLVHGVLYKPAQRLYILNAH